MKIEYVCPEELKPIKSYLENLGNKLPDTYTGLLNKIRENKPGTVDLISRYPAFKLPTVIEAICEVAANEKLSFIQLLHVNNIENIQNYYKFLVNEMPKHEDLGYIAFTLPIGSKPEMAAEIEKIKNRNIEIKQLIENHTPLEESFDEMPPVGDFPIPPLPYHLNH